MSTETLKKQCWKEIENIYDDEFLQVVYALLKNKSKENCSSMSDSQKAELDRSLEKHRNGKMKYYTSAQVKKHVYGRLKK